MKPDITESKFMKVEESKDKMSHIEILLMSRVPIFKNTDKKEEVISIDSMLLKKDRENSTILNQMSLELSQETTIPKKKCLRLSKKNNKSMKHHQCLTKTRRIF